MNGMDRADRPFEFRRYLVGLAVGVILTVSFLGFVIGVTVQTEFDSIRVFSLVTIRPGPLSMAALAGGIATALLLVLFALLRIVSRYDDADEWQ